MLKGVVRVGGAAAASLFGSRGGGLFSAMMAVGLLSCVSAMMIVGPRVYYAMAKDGCFLRGAALLHPRWVTPVQAILYQSAAAAALILTGTFEGLIYYIGFALIMFAALATADSVLSVFTSDPGSAVGAARITSFLTMHRNFENTTANLIGVACANWDGGFAARQVIDALASTGLPILDTRIPFSRRVASSALAKRPVVLRAPDSPVAQAYSRLAEEILSIHRTALAA